MMAPSFDRALSRPPRRQAGHGVDLSIYPHAAGAQRRDYALSSFVADAPINFVRRVAGRGARADLYLGNEGIWKGDEAELIADLRASYRVRGDA